MSSSWDGAQLREALSSAAHWLRRHAPAVDALNVFPVPDGDTGTNMALTLTGALEDVPPDPSCAVVADRMRHATMMRGRGNSGIILSQAFRGLAQALAGHQRIGAAELAQALSQASAAAYGAVLRPVEGTILTVLRAAGEAAHAALRRQTAAENTEAPEPIGGDHTATPAIAERSVTSVAVGSESTASIREVLEAATSGAREALARTPQLLKALRDAGVVDAGGQGLVLVLEGMLRYARGERDEDPPSREVVPMARVAHSAGHGYCTSFVVLGGPGADALRAAFAPLGESLVVAGDERAARVHLHTPRPGDALNAAVALGALDAIEIVNMDRQCAARAGAAPAGEAEPADLPAVGVVAVASGAGFAAIFRSLRAGEVLLGGPGARPSTQELLAAIERLPQREVLLLPNDADGVPAARQAAELSGGRAEVLPTHTMAHGVAALLAMRYHDGREAALTAMSAAAERARVAEITTAVRDARVGEVAVRAGQRIALIDGALVAAHDDPEALLDEVFERLALRDAEIVTIYTGGAAGGREAGDDAARQIAERYPEISIEIHEGGQPLYDIIIAAE